MAKRIFHHGLNTARGLQMPTLVFMNEWHEHQGCGVEGETLAATLHHLTE
jgi:hypothetical protein